MNNEYYVYSEGALTFTYYPFNGLVKCANHTSFLRAIEHFSYRGMEVDWGKSNFNQLNLYVNVPSHLSEEESITILRTNKECLYEQYLEDETKSRSNIIQGNIDNTTGEVLDEEKLANKLRNLVANKKKTRQDIADWFNHFNIELVRKDTDVLQVLTKSRKTVISEGRRNIWKLFELGKLKQLTKEEYSDKMSKHCK